MRYNLNVFLFENSCTHCFRYHRRSCPSTIIKYECESFLYQDTFTNKKNIQRCKWQHSNEYISPIFHLILQYTVTSYCVYFTDRGHSRHHIICCNRGRICNACNNAGLLLHLSFAHIDTWCRQIAHPDQSQLFVEIRICWQMLLIDSINSETNNQMMNSKRT